jgi:hypothetical protein
MIYAYLQYIRFTVPVYHCLNSALLAKQEKSLPRFVLFKESDQRGEAKLRKGAEELKTNQLLNPSLPAESNNSPSNLRTPVSERSSRNCS